MEQSWFPDGLIQKKSPYADNTYSKIDKEIINISKTSLLNSINILNKNRILLDKLVNILLDLETIDNKIFKQTTFGILNI